MAFTRSLNIRVSLEEVVFLTLDVALVLMKSTPLGRAATGAILWSPRATVVKVGICAVLPRRPRQNQCFS